MQHLSEDIKDIRADLRGVDSDIDSGDMVSQKTVFRQLQAHRYSSDTKDRQWLAKWATIVVSLWLFLVLLVLILAHHLSDAVDDTAGHHYAQRIGSFLYRLAGSF